MLLALALNANPNGDGGDHQADGDTDEFIPLHLAASSGFWPACEFLILNGAKVSPDILYYRSHSYYCIALLAN